MRGGRFAGWPEGDALTRGRCVLRNLVATVNLDCKLDLKTITLHARNAEYNPKARGCSCRQRWVPAER